MDVHSFLEQTCAGFLILQSGFAPDIRRDRMNRSPEEFGGVFPARIAAGIAAGLVGAFLDQPKHCPAAHRTWLAVAPIKSDGLPEFDRTKPTR